jgi:hypothetical protein
MLQVVMQNEAAKKVQKALEVAGLSSRDVTPFLKVRVMGLVSKLSASTSSTKEGLITIWNPTEMQVRRNHHQCLSVANIFSVEKGRNGFFCAKH